jgi:hypothetical protein
MRLRLLNELITSTYKDVLLCLPYLGGYVRKFPRHQILHGYDFQTDVNDRGELNTVSIPFAEFCSD